MNRKQFLLLGGLGCGLLLLIAAVGAVLLLFISPFAITSQGRAPVTAVEEAITAVPEAMATVQQEQIVVPTLTAPAPEAAATPALDAPFSDLYARTNPGVVNIRVSTNQGPGGGSGFVLDQEGHIVTNNHVVAPANTVTAVFYNSFEARAEIVGADDDSDLAVIKVAQLPEGVTPLPLGDSEAVTVGEQVIAIGNPFGLGSSMSVGIVSAVGRAIPSGVTPFDIPQAIQTDAAINPGNSGGPLINLQGEIIGVNAQIRTSNGQAANSGVGFAIPANVVRRVAPVLIEEGRYQWPWLGVSGNNVSLLLAQGNELDMQRGAYIHNVIPNGPADEAGLQGSTGQTQVDGRPIPTGGDVIIAADGQQIADFDELLTLIAFKQPGDRVTLTVLRDGDQETIQVELAPRPEEFGS